MPSIVDLKKEMPGISMQSRNESTKTVVKCMVLFTLHENDGSASVLRACFGDSNKCNLIRAFLPDQMSLWRNAVTVSAVRSGCWTWGKWPQSSQTWISAFANVSRWRSA